MRAVPFEVLLLSAIVANTIAVPASALNAGFFPQQETLRTPGLHHDAKSHHENNGKSPSNGERYQCFEGPAQYPSANEWLSFEALWRINRQSILAQNGGDTYVEHFLKEGIERVAGESHIDARVILAVVLQQSHGRVSIGCNAEDSTCGLLQVPHGKAVFDQAKPQASIIRMIREGVQGANLGQSHPQADSALARYLSTNDHTRGYKHSDPYAAIEAYELGRLGELDHLKDGSSKLAKFVSDIANRLIGWNGRSTRRC